MGEAPGSQGDGQLAANSVRFKDQAFSVSTQVLPSKPSAQIGSRRSGRYSEPTCRMMAARLL